MINSSHTVVLNAFFERRQNLQQAQPKCSKSSSLIENSSKCIYTTKSARLRMQISFTIFLSRLQEKCLGTTMAMATQGCSSDLEPPMVETWDLSVAFALLCYEKGLQIEHALDQQKQQHQQMRMLNNPNARAKSSTRNASYLDTLTSLSNIAIAPSTWVIWNNLFCTLPRWWQSSDLTTFKTWWQQSQRQPFQLPTFSCE